MVSGGGTGSDGDGSGGGNKDGEGDGDILAELKGFHEDSNNYNAELLDRLKTDDVKGAVDGSLSKLSSDLKGVINGGPVGGEFSEASSLMGQIGNGADSPLLGKFIDKRLIPLVDTKTCHMPVFGEGTQWEFTLNSTQWVKLKQILTFLLYAITFWCLFDMVTNTGGRK